MYTVGPCGRRHISQPIYIGVDTGVNTLDGTFWMMTVCTCVATSKAYLVLRVVRFPPDLVVLSLQQTQIQQESSVAVLG